MKLENEQVTFSSGTALPKSDVQPVLAKMVRALQRDRIGAPRLLAQLHFASTVEDPSTVLTSVDHRELIKAGLLGQDGAISDVVKEVAKEAIDTDGGQRFVLHQLAGDPIDLSARQLQHGSPKPRIRLDFTDPKTGEGKGSVEL